MRYLLTVLVLALSACTAQESVSGEPSAPPLQTVDPSTGERVCSGLGPSFELVCTYRLDEIPNITRESLILVRGYLHRDDDGLFITSERDGGGAKLRMRIGEMKHGEGSPARVEALMGYLVGLRGTYRPSEGAIEAWTMGYYEEPGVPRPDLTRELDQ